ncbi:MAG: GIY-YIG nuclease family protein [Bacteroidota bacterium]|nr:GIY-YIG nuclease family protein [Bacteroidota bacterium]
MGRGSKEQSGTRGVPKIYAYTYGEYCENTWEYRSGGSGWMKVGFTTGDVRKRIKEQTSSSVPGQVRILWEENAITDHGVPFRDSDVHKQLVANGGHQVHNEWFEVTLDELKIAIAEVKQGRRVTALYSFKMRPEQRRAVEQTAAYYRGQEEDKAKHFLWNAKMRFGKTFASYQLALEMGWTKLLILTYKPAVEDSWRKDLERHQDFQGWQFIGKGERFEDIDESFPYAWLVSFQDIMWRNAKGGIEIKDRLELVFVNEWDCIIIDEYHFGAWRSGPKELYASDDSDEEASLLYNYGSASSSSEDFEKLTTGHRLYLSGTPFRALAEGEFSEDQIYNWTYADEQNAKRTWKGERGEPNPYQSLPQLKMFTYKISDATRSYAESGFDDEFSLNGFFEAKVRDRLPRFSKESEVQRWLDWLHKPVSITEQQNNPGPYADPQLRTCLHHTVWHLPDVASCRAMERLLNAPQNPFYKEFTVVCAAGAKAGIGLKALDPVRNAIGDGSRTKTITLTCGKLLTGVTVPQWGVIFMLRDTKSAETYFQAAFRVQSPWTHTTADGPNKEEIVKPVAYIFDFAQYRALEMVYGFCAKQANAKGEGNPSSEVREFLNFLPILAYDDGKLVKLDATNLMEMATSGIGSAMLAKRWQSSSLVNLNRAVLEGILNNEEFLQSLESMEAFRALRTHTSEILTLEKSVKKAKVGGSKKSTVSKEEREMKNRRKEIREALLKLLTRVPIFMYLTDYREESLVDVIRNVEPALFTKVTGLKIKDFDALCKLGVFNTQILNQAIYTFKRQEAFSLTGGKSSHGQEQMDDN